MKSKLEEAFAKRLKKARIPFERQVKGIIPGRRFAADFILLRRGERVLSVEVMGGIFTGGRHIHGKGYENDARKMLLTFRHGGIPTIYFTAKMVADDECFADLREVWRSL